MFYAFKMFLFLFNQLELWMINLIFWKEKGLVDLQYFVNVCLFYLPPHRIVLLQLKFDLVLWRLTTNTHISLIPVWISSSSWMSFSCLWRCVRLHRHIWFTCWKQNPWLLLGYTEVYYLTKKIIINHRKSWMKKKRIFVRTLCKYSIITIKTKWYIYVVVTT